MKIHKANIEKIVKLNGLREISDLNLLNKGIPSENGLFSYDIFGMNMNERKNIPAYIDLKGNYLHPLVYNNLIRTNRKFESLIMGTKTFKLTTEGGIEESPDGETGLDFLYKIWNKLVFKETPSVFATERKKSIKTEAWVDKWIVLPAFFRDLNTTTEPPSYDAINEDYINIIRMVKNVSQQEQYGFVANITKARIQLIINKIHDDITTKQLREKHGIFKKHILGKNVDFGARLVISAPEISGELPEDVQVRYNNIGIPLATACSIFFPFMVYGVREYFQNEFTHGGKYPYRDKETGEIKYVTIRHPESQFTDEYIIKMIKKFIYGVETRFDTIDIPDNEEGKKLKLQIVGKFGKENTTIRRLATWTDILFIIASEILADKHVLFARYPITNSFGINPSKFNILTTRKTTPAIIGEKYYKYYPKIEFDKKDSSREFIDTLVLSNSYLNGLGGDYDGDMLSIVGLFTNEANEDAEKYTKDKKYILSLTGNSTRIVQRDFVQSIFALTKNPKDVENIQFKNLSRIM